MKEQQTRAITEAAARKALAGFELARTDVVIPVNGARPYSYVTFAGARIEFQQLDREIKYHNGSPVYDAATDKAAAQADRINEMMMEVAYAAANALIADLAAKDARLAVMRDALEASKAIADDAPELNMSNYDHDDVGRLNSAMVEIWQVLNAALADQPTGDGE